MVVVLCGAAPAPTVKSNEEQIRGVADEFAAAWNKHDPTAMAYVWAADGDLINPFGRRARGLTEIQRLFQDEQNNAMKNTTFTIKGFSIRFVDSTLALVDSDAEISGLTNPDGSAMLVSPALLSHKIHPYFLSITKQRGFDNKNRGTLAYKCL